MISDACQDFNSVDESPEFVTVSSFPRRVICHNNMYEQTMKLKLQPGYALQEEESC